MSTPIVKTTTFRKGISPSTLGVVQLSMLGLQFIALHEELTKTTAAVCQAVV